MDTLPSGKVIFMSEIHKPRPVVLSLSLSGDLEPQNREKVKTATSQGFVFPKNDSATSLCVLSVCGETGLLMFVTILAQSLFALVRRHLMSLSFLSAWHSLKCV